MSIRFPASPEPTIGVEIELQTIDPRTFALISGAPSILDLHSGDPHIKKELLQCCLEVNTKVCRNVSEIESDLKKQLLKVVTTAENLGIKLIPAGTHPFSAWYNQDITPDARYQTHLEVTQWTARRLLTFGLHVHVGIDSAEKAIAIFNSMSVYIPIFLALSASSPFWEGFDTGLDSVRSKVFESLPGGGLPYMVKNWTDFQNMIRILQKIKSINSTQELWGDLRPHERYGTLEIRVCDSMPSIDELLAITALVQTIVVWLGDMYDRGIPLPSQPHWILQENKWRAARWGMDCRFVYDSSGRQEQFRNTLETLIETIAPIASLLNAWDYIKDIEKIFSKGNSATRQRKIFSQTNSFSAVLIELEKEFKHSLYKEKSANKDLNSQRSFSIYNSSSVKRSVY